MRLAGEASALKGDKVMIDGTTIGEVTSAVMSPTLSASIAIAMIDSRFTGAGQPVQVASGAGMVPGGVASMPFVDPERKLSKA